jgi:serine/threonine protein kinase
VSYLLDIELIYVVESLQVGSYTNPHYLAIILSPVADCNLKEYLERSETSVDPILVSRLREWLGCLITAVEYLHKDQIRHRDIKPANILVYGTNILLVDFELSLDWRDLGQSTTTASCGRTPLYAAPEVIDFRSCNSKSDVWSLGCVFLEMITVLKGESIPQLRQHFITQSGNHLYFNNPRGISDWLTRLEEKSSTDNAPLQWIPMMLQPDLRLRSRSSAIVEAVRSAYPNSKDINPYFGMCCQLTKRRTSPQTPRCLLCATQELKVGIYHCRAC